MTNIQNHKEYLSGIVERIAYHSPENGFCVLRIKVKNYKDLVTITGNIPSITVGEYIQCSGIWYNDHNYGQQFKATFIKALPPSSIEGIIKYLASGLIKGIGCYYAEKLVNTFGDKVFEVIEQKPHLLSTVSGIGKVRADSICKNWHEQKMVREIMVFLQSHGIGTNRATRIYKIYGEQAIEIVSQNPYRLAQDIRGIGFISADILAKNIGIAENSIIRARAGIKHVLLEATSEGHCGLPQDTLIQKTRQLLGINLDLVIEAVNMESAAGLIILDTIANNRIIFLKSYYIYEKYISNTLLALNKQSVICNEINYQQAIASVEDKLNISLAEHQKQALIHALQSKVMVITGGPGTGKTTLINILLTVLQTQNLIIKLCAPTGRAAKRLAETTKLEAVTIHRLLATDPNHGSFKYNKDNLLQCDYLIIDEMSMVDVSLFYSLLQALPKNISLILVGDVDQLPSIGAGQVLHDIINSNVITTIKLTQIFRQAAASNIIKNAHKINHGQMPDLLPAQSSDFFFVNAEPGDDLLTKIINLIKERIPQKFGFNPINDIQILAPMQRGNSGVRVLNIEIQKALNPTYEAGIFKFGQYFAINDKVMQIENNYNKEVYNGDIGIIKNIDNIEQELVITFDKRDIIYDYNDLDQITLAYAITIHKSQGSEYPAVIIPITIQSYIMLKRNLLYTAISRGKRLVILIGQKKAIAIAVQDKTHIQRYSKLKEWLISC
ncbi:ATP-dependent RecD-like DNA helicase [Candidatus Tisiphia endosymbiont of Nemotelus uliginosus]|uniref:SF1B family DNA helicase RecD2 n=1 Tax=Candidatus Tisiphia endosymbiont of Nemotelus uliginosus TaxID=3077926 RepID=UPI0035C91CD2